MANWCSNSAIIFHEDKVKISDLYRISAGDFFNFIRPSPVELCNDDSILEKQYNLEEFGADNLSDWRLKNWGNSSRPYPSGTKRRISNDGDFMMMSFDTKWIPAIGIYKELEKQGYHVWAYFWEPGENICGSFNFGIVECVNCVVYDEDIPFEMEMVFGIEDYVNGYVSGAECNKLDVKDNEYEYLDSIVVNTDGEDTIDYFQGIAV